MTCSAVIGTSGTSTATDEAGAAGAAAGGAGADALGSALEEGCRVGSAAVVGSGDVVASSGYTEYISFMSSARDSIRLSREWNLSEAAYLDAIVFFAMPPRILAGPISTYFSTEPEPEKNTSWVSILYNVFVSITSFRPALLS